MRSVLLAGCLCALSVPAYADANADLNNLVSDVWAYTLKEQPVYASALGVNDYANELGDYTLAAQDRRAAQATQFLARLDAIPAASLDAPTKVEAGILRRSLNSAIEGNRFGQRAINFTTYSSWHQQLAGMAQNLPFKTKRDFESYNVRLTQYARANDENIAVANVALKAQSAGLLPPTFTGHVSSDLMPASVLKIFRKPTLLYWPQTPKRPSARSCIRR